MLYYSGLSRTLRQLRWVLYPRRCPFCDRVLGSRPACPDCADGLAELRRAPSMRLRGSEHYLGRLDGAAAPYRYTGLARRAVLRAKYQGAPWAAVELGVEMARLLFGSEIRMCGSEPLPEPVPGLDRGYDCILPVPASSKKTRLQCAGADGTAPCPGGGRSGGHGRADPCPLHPAAGGTFP